MGPEHCSVVDYPDSRAVCKSYKVLQKSLPPVLCVTSMFATFVYEARGTLLSYTLAHFLMCLFGGSIGLSSSPFSNNLSEMVSQYACKYMFSQTARIGFPCSLSFIIVAGDLIGTLTVMLYMQPVVREYELGH